MKRVATGVVLLALIAAGAVAVSVGTASTRHKQATTVTIWVGWSAGHELTEFKKVVAEYDQKHADVNVKVVGGINDDKILAAIRSGNVPDVVSSFTSSNVGIYCPSGGWIDLDPLLKQDKIDVNIFPATSRYYTQYKGTRCALPLLADSTGLYYNKALLQEGGPDATAEDAVGAGNVRQEADAEEQGRVDQGRRLRPERELLHRRLRQRRIRATSR